MVTEIGPVIQHCSMGHSLFCSTVIWRMPHSAVLQNGEYPTLQHITIWGHSRNSMQAKWGNNPKLWGNKSSDTTSSPKSIVLQNGDQEPNVHSRWYVLILHFKMGSFVPQWSYHYHQKGNHNIAHLTTFLIIIIMKYTELLKSLFWRLLSPS